MSRLANILRLFLLNLLVLKGTAEPEPIYQGEEEGLEEKRTRGLVESMGSTPYLGQGRPP